MYINQCEKEVKLLGITIDEKLKFNIKRINNLCKNTTRQINLMCTSKDKIDLKESERIHNSYIYPV